MLWIKRILIVAVMLLLAAFTMAFTLDNREVVHVQFMTLKTPDLPLAIFIITGFVLGGICGSFLGMLGSVRLSLRKNGELKRARAECERLRRELKAEKAEKTEKVALENKAA